MIPWVERKKTLMRRGIQYSYGLTIPLLLLLVLFVAVVVVVKRCGEPAEEEDEGWSLW